MIEIPQLVEEVARRLHAEGYLYAEGYPIRMWRQNDWPEDQMFFKLVDGCLKILRALEGEKKNSLLSK